MKKALLIGLVLGLVAVWGVPAMAIDLTASGWIGIKGVVMQNAQSAPPVAIGRHTAHFAVPGPGPSPQTAFMQQQGAFINGRADLGFTLRTSEDLYGQINFRMSACPGEWGNFATAGWHSEGGGNIAVAVTGVFVDFRVPPKLPLWFRLGLQPIAIRPWIFMFENSPGVTVRTMIDPIKLSATGYYVKLTDLSAWSASGGAELYGIDTKIPLALGPVNVAPGVFFFFQNERLAPPVPDARELWWLGVNLDGGVGPVKFQLDFIYNDGEEKYGNPTVPDLGYGSWLINGQVSFAWQKFEVGFAGKYVKGEDLTTADYETFQLPGTANYGSEAMAVSTDFVVFDHGWMNPGPGWPAVGLIDGPSTFWFGYWDVRAFVYYQALDWLRIGAQGGYIGDTVQGGDCIGTDADDDDSIGWEMDFGVGIKIYPNLNLETTFGYLFGGKALSLVGGVEPDDPWVFTSRLMYFF